MNEELFKARRDVERQLKAKFPDMNDRDCEVLADMTIKFGEDINDLMKRTLETFSPLLEDLDASMVAPICLADGAVQLGMYWKQTTIGCIRELKGMADKARASGTGGAGMLDMVMDHLRKLREGGE